MWNVNKPEPVKLLIGILAANEDALDAAQSQITDHFGAADLVSEVWPFTQTTYYEDEMGTSILRQFVSIDKLIDPGQLADIKHKANQIEKTLAEKLDLDLPRPVNLDPGIIEPSKLVLASTKNFSHRIYIGDGMYAELTLSFCRGKWQSFSYTFPDYKEERYHDFLSHVRDRLVEQARLAADGRT
jgi:hypothetical protein